MPWAAFDLWMVGLILTVAVWTIAARDMMAAAVGFLVHGLLLALAWLRLGAADVAIAEAAIGGGLSGVLLLGAASRLRAAGMPAGEEPTGVGRLLAAVLSAAVSAGIAASFLLLPTPAPTLAQAAADNTAVTGVGNPVTAALMAFRAMDTMLEKVVLLLALIAAWSLAADRKWGGRPGPRHRADPAGPLAFLARVLAPIGIVVGVYLLWVGADHPGGAFQGGTVLAAMWLLVMMAGLADTPPIGNRWLRRLLVAGPAVFILVGLGGLALGDAFLAYPEAWAKPLILGIEIVMVLTVAATLALLMAGVPERSGRE